MSSIVKKSSGHYPQSRLYRRLIWAIYAVAVSLRAWRYVCGDFSGENAIMGQMSRDWLFGDIPLFFYGQSHMGSWDTLLSAPLIALFGPSAWIINLWPPLISLGVMIICHRLLKLILSPVGVLAGLCVMAVPPSYWLFYSGYAQTHNSICIMLEALLMLLTIRFWKQERPELWLYAALGFISGAGFYLNFQMGVAIIACALFILLFTWRKFRPLGVAVTIGGTAAGLSPLILYELQRGGEHVGVLNSFSWQFALDYWHPFISNALPIILGFHTPAVQCNKAVEYPLWGLYPVLGVLLLIGLYLLIKQGVAKERRMAWLPVMLCLINIAVVLFSEYGRVLGGFHQTYLLTLFLILPFAWGAFAELAARNKFLIALALSCLVASLNIYNYDNFCIHGLKLLNRPFHLANSEHRYLEHLAQLKSAGVKAMYIMQPEQYSFYAHRKIYVSDPYHQRKASASFRVDMNLNPIFQGMELTGSTRLLGLQHQTLKLAGGIGRWRFKQPCGAARVLTLPSAKACTVDGAALGKAITDHDVKTMFATPGSAKEGQGFVLDLGRDCEVAGFSLIPNKYNDSPAGLKVEAALEDGRFHTIRTATNYWGPFYLSGPHPVLKARHPRADCFFPARKMRYLRLTHLGESRFKWTVRDILLYGPGHKQTREPDWTGSIKKALALIKRKGFKLVYADTWAAAWIKIRLPKVATIGGNVSQNSFGRAEPALNTDWMLHADANTALLVEPKYSGQIMSRLSMARIPAKKTALGAFDLISLGKSDPGKRLAIHGISSNVDQNRAKALLTPGQGRWAGGKPQGPGVYLELDLGSSQRVDRLTLHNPNHPKDYPRGLKVEVSRDGVLWSMVKARLAAPLCFTGQVLMTKPGKVSQYRLESSPETRHLRLSVRGDGGPYWWSVEKVEAFTDAICAKP